ncbi:MAG: TrkH family potassium uptake protein [Pirellulales bacterium]|nr:TrkH family potassium uptake protein [Pirellulales bacterium]
MLQISGSVQKYPARASVLAYAALIGAGAILLALPFSHHPGQTAIGWLDALFTSTSATCVTGLSVRSTEHAFSFWGQVVILGLIQIGGVGIMTLTTFVVFQFGRQASLRSRVVLSESLGADPGADFRWILRNVLLFTATAESIGALVLAVRNLFDQPLLEAVWHGIFHAISAFCNAGFALYDDNLTRYQGDPLVNLTITVLIIFGGLGFPVVLDIRRNWHGTWRERWDRWLVHTKLMLIGSGALVFGGTLLLSILEWDGVLKNMPIWQRPMVAFFHSVSARTAGFNTVDLAAMTNASLFLLILLMLVGGGACSTAGGIKVSTMMVLVCQARAAFAGQARLHLFRRTIAPQYVQRATVTAMLYVITVFAGLTVLLVVEQSHAPHLESASRFLDAFFEVASALGTVGLSMGITPYLSAGGRLVVILLMFIGRLGPISVFAALSRTEQDDRIEFPSESVLIG